MSGPDKNTKRKSARIGGVALLTPGWPHEQFSNGITKYVAKMRPALVEEGLHVSILTGHVRLEKPDENVYDLSEFPEAEIRTSWWWQILLKIAPHYANVMAVVRLIRTAVTHLHRQGKIGLFQMEETNGWARLVRRHVAVPMVVRLHGPWFIVGEVTGAEKDKGYHRRIRDEGKAIAAADGVTAPSQDILDRTRKFYGLDLEMAEAIPNPQAVVPQSERWELAKCDPALILFIGRFDRVKGGDILFKAFKGVLERFPGARVQFAGPDRGLTDDEGKRWGLTEYADAHLTPREAERFEWLGEQPFSALAGLRRKALVQVVCSRYETFGNVATEAMAMGCPVVVSRVGGLAEIVQDGRNGLVCKPEDADDLAEKLCLLLSKPELAAQLGNQAVADCAECHDPRHLAARTIAFYERVLEARAG